MMISELERQFVDVVAREISTYANEQRAKLPHDVTPTQKTLLGGWTVACSCGWRIGSTFFNRADAELEANEHRENPARPVFERPTQGCFLLAARYWGAIETENDCTLAEIVEAASAAIPKQVSRPFDPSAFFAALAVEGIAKAALICRTHGNDLDSCRVSDGCNYLPPSERRVPSWFDDHARFGLLRREGDPDCNVFKHTAAADCAVDGCRRSFIIPPLRIGASR